MLLRSTTSLQYLLCKKGEDAFVLVCIEHVSCLIAKEGVTAGDSCCSDNTEQKLTASKKCQHFNDDIHVSVYMDIQWGKCDWSRCFKVLQRGCLCQQGSTVTRFKVSVK